MSGSKTLHVDLHLLAQFTNVVIPVLALLCFLAGRHLSFYFRLRTVSFLEHRRLPFLRHMLEFRVEEENVRP